MHWFLSLYSSCVSYHWLFIDVFISLFLYVLVILGIYVCLTLFVSFGPAVLLYLCIRYLYMYVLRDLFS